MFSWLKSPQPTIDPSGPLQHFFLLDIRTVTYLYTFLILYIWVNYNISPTWIKVIWGWFPLLTMISSEVAVRSLKKYPDLYTSLIYTSERNHVSSGPCRPCRPCPLRDTDVSRVARKTWYMCRCSMYIKIFQQSSPTHNILKLCKFLTGMCFKHKVIWPYHFLNHVQIRSLNHPKDLRLCFKEYVESLLYIIIQILYPVFRQTQWS